MWRGLDCYYLSFLYKISNLAYIDGYVIQLLSKNLLSGTWYHEMISPKGIVSHDRYLIFVEDQSGVFYPPDDVHESLKTCEVLFKTEVNGKDFQNPKIMQKSKLKMELRNMVLHSLCDYLMVSHVIPMMI